MMFVFLTHLMSVFGGAAWQYHLVCLLNSPLSVPVLSIAVSLMGTPGVLIPETG